jgi:DTW domain-containing protein YfiP
MSDAATPAPRARCYVCMRPLTMCWCGDIPSVVTRTAVVILQHARERMHPFGTARLVARCLPRTRIEVVLGGFAGDLHRPLDVPPDTAVLYPHPAAIDLAELAPADRPSTLLVLDGTWAHAKRLYRTNPWLQNLRHVRINPATPSRYRIRAEPRADYVSTLEAIVEALQILEPETAGLDGVVAAFVRMIDRQVQHLETVTPQVRRKRPRQRASRRVASLLSAANLVVVHAEAAIEPGDATGVRRLVHFVAARVTDGAVFDAVIRPLRAGPPDNLLRHMGLTRAEVDAGEDLQDARARFAAFAGAGAPVCAWMAPALEHASALFAPDTERCVLRASYCNLRGDRAPALEYVAAREGFAPVAIEARGRAGAKVGHALAVARWLRERAVHEPGA